MKMKTKMLMAVCVCAAVAACAADCEILVSREGQRVERWSAPANGGKWTKTGDFIAGGKAGVQPTGLAYANGVVYIGDALGGGRVRMFGPDGTDRGILAPLGCRPDQLCVSPDVKRLYVSCVQEGVFRFDLATGAGGMYIPETQAGTRAVKFGGDGLLYVGCRAENSVRVYDAAGAKPQLKGTLPAERCSGAFDFFDSRTLFVPGAKPQAIDLAESKSVFLAGGGVLGNTIGACRLGGGVCAADFTAGKIWRFERKTSAAPECVAEGVACACALLNLDAKPLPPPSAALSYKAPAALPGTDFERLKFGNPGAVTYLKGGFGTERIDVFDYDGDGKKDIVVTSGWKGQVWEGCYFFRNPGGGAEPVFPKSVKIPRDRLPGIGSCLDAKGNPIETVWRTNICFNARQLVDFDGDGKKDLIISVGERPIATAADVYDKRGDATQLQMRAFVYWCKCLGGGDGGVRYGEPRMVYLENDLPMESFGWCETLIDDWDGDGDLDIILVDFKDTMTCFENVGTRTQPVYTAGRFLRAPDGTRLHPELCMTRSVVADWDGDGRNDIVMGEEDSRVCWFRNTGKTEKGLPVFEKPSYFRQEADELNFGVLATPFAYDLDGDGDEDIVCGNSQGQIAFIENLSGKGVERPKWAPPKCLTEPDGKPIRIQAGKNGSLQGPCESKWGYTTVSVADWDGDGLPDVMANSIWGLVKWWKNIGTRAQPKFDCARDVDDRKNVVFPEDDGLWTMDMKTGECRLIVSTAAVKDRVPAVNGKGCLSYFCHTVISKDGAKVYWLSRSVEGVVDAKGGKNGKCETTAFTCSRDGSEIRRCFPDGWGSSHFNWMPNGEHTMVVTARRDAKPLMTHVEFTVGKEDEVKQYGPGILDWDGHCIYSPDCRFISSDGYWNANGDRTWVLVRREDQAILPLGTFHVPDIYGKNHVFTRSDLHPRFRRDGSQIGFNSVHEGTRQVYVRDIKWK